MRRPILRPACAIHPQHQRVVRGRHQREDAAGHRESRDQPRFLQGGQQRDELQHGDALAGPACLERDTAKPAHVPGHEPADHGHHVAHQQQRQLPWCNQPVHGDGDERHQHEDPVGDRVDQRADPAGGVRHARDHAVQHVRHHCAHDHREPPVGVVDPEEHAGHCQARERDQVRRREHFIAAHADKKARRVHDGQQLPALPRGHRLTAWTRGTTASVLPHAVTSVHPHPIARLVTTC